MSTSPRLVGPHVVPPIGFGTSPLKGQECVQKVLSALEIGYRLIDTAVIYENEREVGEAIRRSSIPRNEIWVTSKLPGRDHEYRRALASVERSLERLGLEYIDLHLIHWPNPAIGKYVEAWRALLDLQLQGLIRLAGVSNFTHLHIQRLIEDTGFAPGVNQIELHPLLAQERMLDVHARLGIRTESWSPLGRVRSIFGEGPIAATAHRHGVSSAQVILRWHVQLGSVPLPRSASVHHQRENFDVFGFELSDTEMATISAMKGHRRQHPDPDPDRHIDL